MAYEPLWIICIRYEIKVYFCGFFFFFLAYGYVSFSNLVEETLSSSLLVSSRLFPRLLSDFYFTFKAISNCLDLCSFILSLDIRLSSVTILFQNTFGDSRSFDFHISFTVSLSIVTKSDEDLHDIVSNLQITL